MVKSNYIFANRRKVRRRKVFLIYIIDRKQNPS